MEATFRPQGGVDYNRRVIRDAPDVWADLVNFRPVSSEDGSFLVSDFGLTILRAEIPSATFGTIKRLGALAPSSGVLEKYAVGTKRIARDTGAAWASIQDASDFTAATTDYLDMFTAADAAYFLVPVDGAANAIRKHTGGAGAVTVLGGSPQNSGLGRYFANRACMWETYSGATLQPQTFQYSDRDVDNVYSDINRVTLAESGDEAAGIETLDQLLVLFKRFSAPVLVEPTGNPDDPLNYGALPIATGLINRGAYARCGHRGIGFCGTGSVYLFNNTRLPTDIGVPIQRMLFPPASGARVIGGYHARTGQAETFYLFTNGATIANAANVPNSITTTFQYFGLDFGSGQWFRGDLTEAPLAFGQYFEQIAGRGQGNATIMGSLLGTATANGSTIYTVDHTATTRNTATFTRSALTPVFTLGTLALKRIARITPLFTYLSAGSLNVTLYVGQVPGEIPAIYTNTAGQTSQNRAIDLQGSSKTANAFVDFQDCEWGRFFQIRFDSTADVRLEGFRIEYDVNEGSI